MARRSRTRAREPPLRVFRAERIPARAPASPVCVDIGRWLKARARRCRSWCTVAQARDALPAALAEPRLASARPRALRSLASEAVVEAPRLLSRVPEPARRATARLISTTVRRFSAAAPRSSGISPPQDQQRDREVTSPGVNPCHACCFSVSSGTELPTRSEATSCRAVSLCTATNPAARTNDGIPSI